jgi:hypothetical protein
VGRWEGNTVVRVEKKNSGKRQQPEFMTITGIRAYTRWSLAGPNSGYAHNIWALN